MPVHAAAGSRNSSRRCASPREIRTPGRWRRNRLVHSSIANRRRPRSDAPSSRRRRRSRRPWRAPSVSINKEIELGVRGRWPPLSECTICSDPAPRCSSCREVGCAALQTIRREYAAPPHGSVPSRSVGFFPISKSAKSPKERQRNQRLIVRSPVGVQQLSNKRLRTGMDDRAQTPPRFIGDSTWMSRAASRPNRLGSVSSPVR